MRQGRGRLEQRDRPGAGRVGKVGVQREAVHAEHAVGKVEGRVEAVHADRPDGGPAAGADGAGQVHRGRLQAFAAHVEGTIYIKLARIVRLGLLFGYDFFAGAKREGSIAL